jgi:hypothetical protein
MIIYSRINQETILKIILQEYEVFDLSKVNKSFIAKADTIIIDGYFSTILNFITNKTTKLIIHCPDFNQELKYLPSTITLLDLYYNIKKNDLLYLPFGIKSLKIKNTNYSNYNLSNLPSSIEYLELISQLLPNINNLPNSIKHITLEYSYFQFNIEKLPENLETIIINNADANNQLIINIPYGLNTLTYNPIYLEQKDSNINIKEKLKDDIKMILGEDNIFKQLNFIINSRYLTNKIINSLQKIYAKSGITFTFNPLPFKQSSFKRL